MCVSSELPIDKLLAVNGSFGSVKIGGYLFVDGGFSRSIFDINDVFIDLK